MRRNSKIVLLAVSLLMLGIVRNAMAIEGANLDNEAFMSTEALGVYYDSINLDTYGINLRLGVNFVYVGTSFKMSVSRYDMESYGDLMLDVYLRLPLSLQMMQSWSTFLYLGGAEEARLDEDSYFYERAYGPLIGLSTSYPVNSYFGFFFAGSVSPMMNQDKVWGINARMNVGILMKISEDPYIAGFIDPILFINAYVEKNYINSDGDIIFGIELGSAQAFGSLNEGY